MGIDIAGSIRVPSVCNGIYGFRLSVGLIPHGGVRDLTVPGTDGVRSTVGPMATSNTGLLSVPEHRDADRYLEIRQYRSFDPVDESPGQRPASNRRC